MPSRLLVLTDRVMCARHGRSLPDTVAEAVAGGARTILLREKDMEWGERLRLGEGLSELLSACDGRLIVASDTLLAGALGVTCVHLSGADRPPRDPGLLFGRSCHGLQDLERASRDGALYASISPVFVTPSKPGYGPALGLPGLHRLSGMARLPLYALGGMQPGHARACLDAGAHGVAVMGAVMSARDPATVTAQFMTALAGS